MHYQMMCQVRVMVQVGDRVRVSVGVAHRVCEWACVFLCARVYTCIF